MTFTASGRSATSACNGVTVDFPVPFQFQAGGLFVYLLDAAGDDNDDGTLLTEGTDYTVSGDGDAGTAQVTTAIAWPTGKFLRRWRETSRDQIAEYPTGPFPAEPTQRTLDRAAMALEEIGDDAARLTTRAVLAPAGEDGFVLPSAAARANKFQAYDSLGGPVAAAGTTTPDLALVAANTPFLAGSGAHAGYLFNASPLWIGSGTYNGSTDAGIVLSRLLGPGDVPLGSPHGISVNLVSSFGGGLSENAYDDRSKIVGGAMNHHCSYQSGITFSGSADVVQFFHNSMQITLDGASAKLGNAYMNFVQQPVLANGASYGDLQITGLLMNGIPRDYGNIAVPNHVFNSNGLAPAYMAGQLTAGNLVASATETTAGAQIHAKTPDGTACSIRVQEEGQNWWDLRMKASATGLSIFESVGGGSGTERITIQTAGHVLPGAGDAQNLGSAGLPWKDGWIVNAWTVTSDETAKKWLGGMNAADVRAGLRIADELGFFQWLDSLAAAEDPDNPKLAARWHFGVRAQQAARILIEEGVEEKPRKGARPSFRNGWLAYDRWDDEYEPVIDRAIVKVPYEVPIGTGILDRHGKQICRKVLHHNEVEQDVSRLIEGDHEDMKAAAKAGRARLARKAGDRWGVRLGPMTLYVVAALNADRHAVRDDLAGMAARLAVLEKRPAGAARPRQLR